jgi:phosphatidylglycerol lysyltransferase
MIDGRATALALLRRYGRNATSFQVLEPGLSYWFAVDADGTPLGCVAYFDTGGAWVVAGAPIGPMPRVWSIGAQFAQAAARAGRRVVFVAAERWARDAPWLRLLEIGAQPVWDPARWPRTLEAAPRLREQLRRAVRQGVRVRQVASAEMADPRAPVREACQALIDRWLASRRMAPMGFLVTVRPFDVPEERRYLVAERDGRTVGLLVAVPIFHRRGWLIEDLLRDESAPNGTIELLFDDALRLLDAEGAGLVTLGMAPLAGARGPLGVVRATTRWLYDFDGLLRFKQKLRPDGWEPVYLAWPAGQGAVTPVVDCLRAFAHGSLRRFALASLVHRARRGGSPF